MNPTVVAFDLSLTSSGVADDTGTRRIRPKTTGEERLVNVRDAVLTQTHPTMDGLGPRCMRCVGKENRPLFLYGDHPDLVVLEGYSYGSPNAAHPVGELGGVVRVALHEAGIPFEVVPPASIKIFACGKGNAKKPDVLLAAVRRLDYQGNSTDEADALWLYALAMHALGSPIVTLPATHLRALTTVKWKLAST